MIPLVDSVCRFIGDPAGWLLERWRRDRLGEERHEFHRQALVDAEAEEDVFEGEFWCNEHDTFCDHKPPYCTGCGSTHAAEHTCLRWAQSGIPASGADASPPVVSGVAPPRISPTGGPQLAGWERELIDPAYAEVMRVLAAHKVEHFEPLDAWDCPCGERYYVESDWREHLGAAITDALSQAQ